MTRVPTLPGREIVFPTASCTKEPRADRRAEDYARLFDTLREVSDRLKTRKAIYGPFSASGKRLNLPREAETRCDRLRLIRAPGSGEVSLKPSQPGTGSFEEERRALSRAAAAEFARQQEEALEFVRQRFAAGDTLIPLSKLSWVTSEPILAPVAKRLRKKLRSGKIPLYRITNRTLAFESDLCQILGASLEEFSERVARMVRRARKE